MGTLLILAPIALFSRLSPTAFHYLFPLTIGTRHRPVHHREVALHEPNGNIGGIVADKDFIIWLRPRSHTLR